VKSLVVVLKQGYLQKKSRKLPTRFSADIAVGGMIRPGINAALLACHISINKVL